MADQFQIPQRTPPQGSPPAPPYDLVQSYINRPFQYAKMVPEAIAPILENYYKQQQLKAGAFEAGGSVLMNALYGNGQQASMTPQGGTAGITPTVPTQASQAPAGATAGVSPQPGPTPSQPGQGAIPETIQATLDHPTLGVHAQKILDLQKQMGQNAQMGKYGQMLNAALKDQLNAETALMSGEQFQQGQARQEKQFKESQAAEESRFQRGRTAESVSKTGEDTTRIGQLRGLYNDLKTAVASNKPGLTAGISGRLASATGGKFGSTAAADLQNVAAPMTAALNYELTKRFNESEADFLMKSMVPSPVDQPAFAQQKLKRLNQMISALESGNENNIKNVASTLATGQVPNVVRGVPQENQQKATAISSKEQYDALPNGASFTWNGQQHIKGKF